MKGEVSQHQYLLKKTTISVTPLNVERYSGHLECGKVVIPLPIPKFRLGIYDNDAPIHANKTKIERYGGRYRLPQPQNKKIFDEEETPIFSRNKLLTKDEIVVECRNVFRSKYLDVSGHGTGGRFVLNSIVLEIAKV